MRPHRDPDAVLVWRGLMMAQRPAVSWWCGLDRAAFRAAVAQHATRMTITPEGWAVGNSITAKDDPALSERFRRREVGI